MSGAYRFFQNSACEYFPCHQGVKEEDFNCLFCFCPLYCLKEDCGGDFSYHRGVKDCSACTVPHGVGAYDRIMERMGDVIDLVKKL